MPHSSPQSRRTSATPDPVIAEAARWALDQHRPDVERRDARRLIDVGARGQARIDMRDLERAAAAGG